VANGLADHRAPPRAMQLGSMLRGEGFKGNENQTASELHGNGCTAFLNLLQTSRVSIKQMILGHQNQEVRSPCSWDFQKVILGGFFRHLPFQQNVNYR